MVSGWFPVPSIKSPRDILSLVCPAIGLYDPVRVRESVCPQDAWAVWAGCHHVVESRVDRFVVTALLLTE